MSKINAEVCALIVGLAVVGVGQYIRVLRKRCRRLTDVCDALDTVVNAQNEILVAVFKGLADGEVNNPEWLENVSGMMSFYEVVMSANLADLAKKYGPIDEDVSGEG